LFPGRRKVDKEKQNKAFANDIRGSCTLIINTLMRTYWNDFTKVAECLPAVLEATLLCYTGDCSKCKTDSVVCSGEGNSWWIRSMYLGTYGINNLDINEKNTSIRMELRHDYITMQWKGDNSPPEASDHQYCRKKNRLI